MIEVVLVDDHTLVRQGIRSLLELDGGIDVVAEAEDGRAGLEAIERHVPDVVLLDLRMPRYDGLWTLAALAERNVSIPVLVLTTFDDDEAVLKALSGGARGYLLKDVTLDQLVGAVESLAGGGWLAQPGITDRALRAVRDREHDFGSRTGFDGIERLTARELDVLRLLAGGYTNREIAGSLHLAEGTVKNHVSTVLVKLGARDRANAVLRALHHGLLG